MFKSNYPKDSLHLDFMRFSWLHLLIFQEVQVSNFCIHENIRNLDFMNNWNFQIWSSIGQWTKLVFSPALFWTRFCTVWIFSLFQGINDVQMPWFKKDCKLDILRLPSKKGKLGLLSIWGVNQKEQNLAETGTQIPGCLARWFSLLVGLARGVFFPTWSHWASW